MDHHDRGPIPEWRTHLIAAEGAAGGQTITGSQIGQERGQVCPPHLNAMQPAEQGLAGGSQTWNRPQGANGAQQQGMHAEHQLAAGQPPGQLEHKPHLAGQATQAPSTKTAGGQEVARVAQPLQGLPHLEAEALNAAPTANVVRDQKNHKSRAS
jgi:hypothetical protein